MSFLQRIKDGAAKVTEKAQGSVEVSKLNSRISDIEHELEIEFTKMGKIFYEGYRSRDMSLAEGKMIELSRNCSRLQEEIEDVRMRIAELKNERLCRCGHIASLDANFCPSCGRNLDEGIRSSAAAPAPANASYKLHKEDTEEEQASSAELNLTKEPEYSFKREEILEDEDELPLPLEEYNINIQDSKPEQEHADELEKERERQLELDRRIRDWKANEYVETEHEDTASKDVVKCQICRVDLPKGSMWCPRCGSEQI